MTECSHPLAQAYTNDKGVVMCANYRFHDEPNTDHVRPGGTEQLVKEYAELFASESYKKFMGK